MLLGGVFYKAEERPAERAADRLFSAALEIKECLRFGFYISISQGMGLEPCCCCWDYFVTRAAAWILILWGFFPGKTIPKELIC